MKRNLIWSGNHSLLALTTTALALPGISMADSPPAQSTASYKFSNYAEDDLPRREAPFGERERYDIDVHQFRLLTPTGRNTAFQLDANREFMSGASPWFTVSGPDGDPIVNLSGASGIRDNRYELSMTGSYFFESGTIGANVGLSEEDDYRSRYAGVSGQKNLNQDMTIVSMGLSYAEDSIFPTDAKSFNRVTDEHKYSSSGFISISQIINQTSSFQLALSLTELSGFLSDPYKLVDIRPEHKTQTAFSSSYRKYFIGANAALHFDYRYYNDDFGISSHTASTAWHQNIGRNLRIVPHLRYYSQSAANFFSSTDDFSKSRELPQSSDYRLSAFGAVSGGIDLVVDLGDWNLYFNTERYIANDKYSAYDVTQPAAALVSYFRMSLGVDYSF